MLIIGITGTLGAGKGTIVDYLVRKKGFLHYSVRGFITEEILHRNMTINRDNMVIVANDLRKQHTPSYIVDQLYKQALASGEDCVIESIRTPGEIDSLKSRGDFYLFAVDAKPELRYERIRSRKSETDLVSYETFLANEQREMGSTNPNHQNLKECIRRADFLFTNNGDMHLLFVKVEEVLTDIRKPSKKTQL